MPFCGFSVSAADPAAAIWTCTSMMSGSARAGPASLARPWLSIDIPPDCYHAECVFWAELTGWPRVTGSRPEFAFLDRPAGLPLRLLLQRLDSAATRTCTAHLDLACDDVAAERSRQVVLGAEVVRETPTWTTLRDPAGLSYCVTGRDPGTGKLPSSN